MKPDQTTSFFGEVLESILPNRTKRLILLGSLCGKLINKVKIDNEYLSMLNTQFSLCREEEALKLPLAISDFIWKEIPPEAVSNSSGEEKELATLAKKLMEGVPDWLRYDRENYIVDDLAHLLKFNSVFIRTMIHH